MYKEQKTNDYNHVLNKLQDYMLTGKLMANISYNQSFSNDKNKNNNNGLFQMNNDKYKTQLVKENKDKDSFFFPKEKDQLFWCFYIIKYGFEKYDYPGSSSFVNEKSEKFKQIEHLRNNKQQLKVKKIKNIKEEVEDELANKQTVGMKTFIALCIANNINIIYIHKRKCFEFIFDEQSPIYVVHCHNNSDSSGYKYCYEENVSKEQIDKYRSEYFKWECVDKPLKAMSSYKLDELIELCKKTGLTEIENKKKTNLYEWLVMNL
uniref:Uncharacterized protein n=1 Tax=viral metagenome TaxID=1070528 RepID=A0A6C0D838_9ZZZZ